MATSSHRWKIYRSGGVDQVAVQTGDDLRHLHDLDPKLWIALSMPTRGVEVDPRTLDILDTDRDGHVRQPEVLSAVKWATTVYKDVGDVLEGGDMVALDRLQDGAVLTGARRLLANLGKKDAKVVTLGDATSAEKMFAGTVFNGDGVIPASAADGEVATLIEEIISTHGSVPDRGGQPGVDQARIDAFFAEATALANWYDGVDANEMPLGDATGAAADVVRAVRAKVDDYFTRCRLAAFDSRAAAALNSSDAELSALSAKELSVSSSEVASLPLAKIDASGALPLGAGINPAWQARISTLVTAAITPLLGARAVLTENDWQIILGKLAAHEAWRGTRPAGNLDKLPIARLRALRDGDDKAGLSALVAKDLAVKPEIDSVSEVEKLCRYQRDLGKVLNNYVNFSQFYARKGGVFQAGTLYLDGRGCTLVFEVTDASKHAAMAPMSGAYLAYCDCVRGAGEKKTIAAAFTSGDVDNLLVGRNGVFVDRQGRDWEATITKIVENPISIRQAFWSPYKKLVRMLEERAAKRAADADAASNAKLQAGAAAVMDRASAAPADPTVAAPAPSKKMDIGMVAAIGVAVGGIAAVVTAVLAGVFSLGKWMPLGIAAIMLVISAPSMILAYMKLRRRNLGPLLDANGWAINSLTRINIPLGTALTDLPLLPPGAQRTLTDPYAEKRPPWKLYAVLLVLVGGLAGWYFGKLDEYLPERATSMHVLGSAAPAAKKAARQAAEAAAAPAHAAGASPALSPATSK
jgi:hypothetical protein